MYLSGSKWNTKKKRKRSRPFVILVLVLLIAGLIYVERIIVPTVPPLFVITPTPTRSPASFVMEAESLFQSGKLTQAERSYEEAISIDPDGAAYYTELARIQVFKGEYEEAVTNASNAVLLDPNSAKAKAVLGWAQDFQGNLVDALGNVERGLDLDPDSALIHAYYAEVLIDYDIGSFEQAVEEAETAVRLDPNLMEAHRSLGYVWEMTGNYDLAYEAYQTALRINPNLSTLHLAVGNMYFNQGDTGRAIDSYLQASVLAPLDVTPLRLITQAYARVGEFGKASQYATNAVEIDPSNPRLHGDLGRMYYKNDDYESAIREFSLVVRGGRAESGEQVEPLPLDPADLLVVEFYYTYGLALAKADKCELAIPISEVLIRGVPDNEFAIVNAQEILVICGELEPTATPEAESEGE